MEMRPAKPEQSIRHIPVLLSPRHVVLYLRDLERFAALERRHVRIHAAERRVERRLEAAAYLVPGNEYAAQEIVGEVRVRAAVASCGDAGRKRFFQRVELRREFLLKPAVDRSVGAVASLRAVDAPGLAMIAGSVPHHGHSCRAAVGRLEERDFVAERIVVRILRVLEIGQVARDADA